MLWRAKTFEFQFPRPTLVVGVVNVTPDSFSDGGQYFSPESAVAHGVRLCGDGADLLDIGGESTRPGAIPVPEDEELHRVLPVIRQLREAVSVPLSIDTCKPRVAALAIEAGASVINDVASGRPGDAMLEVVARTGAGYVAMHMQGTPESMQQAPVYTDVVAEVRAFFSQILDRAVRIGVSPEQIVLDVGIGFGKNLEHNLELLGRIGAFRELRRPLMLGVSRKSFIGRLVEAPVDHRLPGGLAAACVGVADGVSLIRTHDVAETVQALRVAESILRHRTGP
ncbi:MAG: dihydropteroate synthase [Verrucomicrobiales bacterium]|nr:dihydropteroate synthase [Verrucomicrobiales bacterium]